MSISETNAHLKSRVWQAIAQSKLDLSPLPDATIEALVSIVAEAALQEMDAQMGRAVAEQNPLPATPLMAQTAPAAADAPATEDERVLWEGRSFLSLTKYYRITTERVRFSQGMLSKDREDIELVRIQDLDQTQTFGERLLNIGDIIISSHDTTQPKLVLENVGDVQRVHEILRRAVLAARQRHNFMYREEM